MAARRAADDGDGQEWKDGRNQMAMELLRWTLLALDEKGVEANWKLLYPPILKMLDDPEIKWKVLGGESLTQLLRTTRPSFLSRTGLGPVFETTLRPFFAYLPSLTPENEAVALLDAMFPAIIELAEVMYHADAGTTTDVVTLERKRVRLLNDIVNDGMLAPLAHALPSTYPELATTILSHLPPLLRKLGINSVRHLSTTLSELSLILQNPFVLAKPKLVLATIQALKALIENAWPRIGEHLPVLMAGVCKIWWRCCEEVTKGGQEVGHVKEGLKEIVRMLDAVLGVDDIKREEWEAEKVRIVEVSAWMEGLFESKGGEVEG